MSSSCPDDSGDLDYDPLYSDCVIDSDVDDASLTSSLCNDYFTNVLHADTNHADSAHTSQTLHNDNIISPFNNDHSPDAHVIPPSPPPEAYDVEETPDTLSKRPKKRRAQRALTVQRDRDRVIQEITCALEHFTENSVKNTKYACAPMANSRVRLAMHLASELLGVTTLSEGEGRQRRVILTWERDEAFAMAEAELLEGVKLILDNLFPIRAHAGRERVAQGKGARKTRPNRGAGKRERKRQAELAYMRRQAAAAPNKGAGARERKRQAGAAYMRNQVPAAVVEEKIAKQDWKGLEALFEEMPPLSSGGRKKKGRRKSAPEYVPVGSEHVASGGMSSGRGQARAGRKRAVAQGLRDAKPIGESNKGFEMLAKMGWKEGQGLGVDNEGRREPLQPERKGSRTGLGAK